MPPQWHKRTRQDIRQRDRRLERKKTHREVIRQSIDLEIAKLIFESSIRFRKMSDWILWKCRPPQKAEEVVP
jgi:hypothetical protein